MSEKIAYLFGKDVKYPGRTHTKFVISEGGIGGIGIDVERVVPHYRSLREKGFIVIDDVVPEGFPATWGFRLLTESDRDELKKQEWIYDHPGLLPEEGELIDKIKAQGIKKEGVLWVFEFPKIPHWMEEELYDINNQSYFLSENNGDPLGVRIILSQFIAMLRYFGEVCNFRNTSQPETDSFREIGLNQNPDRYEAQEFFEKYPPITRPLNQTEFGQISQSGIEVLVATAQPR